MDSIQPLSERDLQGLILAPVRELRDSIPQLNPSKEFTFHGTTIASFFVENGSAVIAVSDGKVSENAMLQAASLEFKKLIEIDAWTVMAISGSASFGLLYARSLRSWVETMERITEEPISTRAKVNMLSKILRDSLPISMGGFAVMPILTVYDEKRGPRIFLFTPDGSVVTKSEYAISGSGRISEGSLLVGHRRDMTREEGIEFAKSIVKNANKMDKATGGRIFIKVVSKEGIESLDGGFIDV